MTTALAGAVELLDRSLAWTRVALAQVEPVPGTTPTPCHGWSVAQLLHHMDDGLDAYTEAATGQVALRPTPGQSRLDSIRLKACALLGWWVDRPAAEVDIGDHRLPAEVVLGAAALEITVHGWDLRQAAGEPAPIPEALARPLLEVARAHGAVRPPCLSPVSATPRVPDDSGSWRLLAWCGRT
ncbi:maleylpyruvate isomerase family mycothiol-dependent enzyme [Nocardioides coralli]|uniref:maleylpyruvate isomerase family mycothiol-dependent enzyme n=1 Tax=Nocardioides coralli TaxID=2872154 RepID=UPI001CA43FB6|nr:maleylpyruvate isomerase family mycothiol-dependent enzyme [Nocardioides coralli]QZY29052.1 maleylpyruvate isomerase family mycothiol-dependent enzyme [Nocardioides coralli]